MPNTKIVVVAPEAIKSVNVPPTVPPEKVEEIVAATTEHVEQKVAEAHAFGVEAPKPEPMSKKTTTVVDSKDLKAKVPDVQLYGNPDAWKLICKASSQSEGWMKSTKAMEIKGAGVLVQVSTQQGNWVAEALQYIPGCFIQDNGDGDIAIVAYGDGDYLDKFFGAEDDPE